MFEDNCTPLRPVKTLRSADRHHPSSLRASVRTASHTASFADTMADPGAEVQKELQDYLAEKARAS